MNTSAANLPPTVAPTSRHFSTTLHEEAEKELFTLVACSLGSFLFSFALFLLKKVLERSGSTWRNHSLLVKSVDTSAWAVLYISFSVTMVVYNKWFLNAWEGGFKFPLFVSMCHMLLKLVLSTVAVRCCYGKDQVVHVPRQVWLCSAVPVGVTTALDIAASNLSFIYISIPFYTVVKSTSVLFVLFFSILYKLQPCQLSLIAVSFLISTGVAMSVYGDSATFSHLGFGLVITASCIGGYRWALTQLFMLQIGSNMNGLITVYTISPAAAVTLVPFCLLLEAGPLLQSKFVTDWHLLLQVVFNIIGTGVFAFGMILVELALIERTSSLSLSIVSYVKQFLQIFLAVLVFGTSITLLNSLGMIVTVFGLLLYSYIKTRDHNEGRSEDEDGSLKRLDENEEGISMIATGDSHGTYASNGNGNSNGYSTIELTDELAKT